MEKLTKNYLELTLYQKTKYGTWYCDYYFYNGDTYERGTTKASGYGYDKHSTALSQAINHFNYMFTFKRGIKWENEFSSHSNLKNKHYYGCLPSKYIDYGIGASSVLNCLSMFKNVKVLEQHYGKYEDYFKIEIDTTPEQLKKEFIKNDKKANDKKTTKEQRKELINKNKKILKLLETKEDANNEN